MTGVTSIPLLRADRYCWSDGHALHQLAEDLGATLCGRAVEIAISVPVSGISREVTCRICLRAIRTREKYQAMTARWERDEQQRQDVRSAWQQEYAVYLLSPVWQQKRQRVFLRAAGACEGCGCRQASQVHHLRYPRGCTPGSAEWIAREKLFDLAAVCEPCHDDIHLATAS